MWVNLRSGHLAQGGSTLTQQLMKNFFLTEERTLRRKLTEAAMALVVERRFSKQEILENYLNEIYLGQRGSQAIHGVWEAADFYFAKEPHELSIGEVALLAGLIRAPNRYSPFRDAAGARQRRTEVLAAMRAAGDITGPEFDAAAAEPLRETAPRPHGNDAPYFLDVVRAELADSYPAEVLTGEGLQVFTTLDTRLQQLAARSLQGGLADLERRFPRLRTTEGDGPLQGCLIAIQPNTGAIKAMMGGRDYASTQFNRCTQAVRQPGSVFKPFTYLAAFETTRHAEAHILPTTRIEDAPFSWPYDGQVWTPANYRKEYLGLVSVRTALELSLNAATARVAQRVGLEPIRDVARRMGITSPLPAYPSVVLGAAEVSPFEVAQAFAVLANAGVRAVPQAIKKVTDRGGLPVERHPVQIDQVVPADTAYLVTHLLEGVLDAGTGRPARARGFVRPAAGKTGTTNDYGDAWFVGFTPDLLVVVWVGFDHKRPLQLTGGQAALPIWTEFMKQATAGVAPASFVAPPGVAVVRIDPTSGALATPQCPQTLDEAFYTGDEPTTPCPLHDSVPAPLDAATADGGTAP
jgi:penicillin-binding protein 1B